MMVLDFALDGDAFDFLVGLDANFSTWVSLNFRLIMFLGIEEGSFSFLSKIVEGESIEEAKKGDIDVWCLKFPPRPLK